MAGLGDTLYAPHGATFTLLLALAKPEDGSAYDLTGATDLAFYLKSSPYLADADAELTLTVGDGITVIDAEAGLVQVQVTAAQHATLNNYGTYHYSTVATLADGTVIRPDLLRGEFINDPASALEQEQQGAAIKRLDAATGTLTPVTPDMSNYLLNRYDLTGLTGGDTTDLDGLAEETLDALQNGARLVLTLTATDTEKIRAEYQLGAIGADVEAAPWIIVCDNDTTRCWRLDRGSVSKAGQPAAYNATSGKFHRVWAVGADGSATPSVDASGFSFPA